MQLNITTDYAIRVIFMLSQLKRQAPASEIAQTLVIPPNYLMKVLTRLKAAGLISATLGMNGGYSLEKQAEDISFKMVFEAMGDSVRINRCLEDDHYCSRYATETCPVHAFYGEIQSYLDEKFASTSIANIMGEKDEENAG